MKEKKRGTLLKNTVMLYILTVSGYFFSFITVPHQTRILGAALFGEVGFAQSIALYFQLVLDFGFLLSATEDVARRKEDRAELSRILSAVLLCKLALGFLSFAVISGLCLTVPRFREYALLHQLFFLGTFFSSLLPDFLYRGLEQMGAITCRAVGVKLFFTVFLLVLLRGPEDYYWIPLLNALGALGACIWAYLDVRRRLGLRLVRVELRYARQTLKRSAGYFVSRIASTVYSATNTVVVGLLFPGSPQLGYYTAAEKLSATARSAFSPIGDSLYPYMVRSRDYKLVKKLLLVLMPAVLLGCGLVAAFAEPFCALLLGAEYAGAGELLGLLMPAVALALPTYVFGFPVLSPLGLAKYANRSVVIGAVWHGCLLAGLYAFGGLNGASVCIATSITEALVLSIRLWAVLRKGKFS